MPIARYYIKERNGDGAFIDGVPLRDIDEAEWDALTERQRRAADATPFYRKSRPPAQPSVVAEKE